MSGITVAGVDFGTLSTRVTLLNSERGRLGTASAEYPLHRKREDPDYATQSHDDQMMRSWSPRGKSWPRPASPVTRLRPSPSTRPAPAS